MNNLMMSSEGNGKISTPRIGLRGDRFSSPQRDHQAARPRNIINCRRFKLFLVVTLFGFHTTRVTHSRTHTRTHVMHRSHHIMEHFVSRALKQNLDLNGAEYFYGIP